MGAVQRRAEGDHLHVGILASEQAALQSCVDGHHGGLFLVELLVGLFHHLQQAALHIGLPSRIGASELTAAASQFGEAHQSLGQHVLGRVNRAAKQSHDGELLAVGLHDGEVQRGLHQSGHILAHADNAVGGYHNGIDEFLCVGFGHHLRGHLHILEFHEEVWFHVAEFFLHPAGHLLKLFHDAVFMLFRHGENHLCVARDGITHVAAAHAYQTDATLGNPAYVTEHDLVGVAASAVDLHSGVTALQATDGELHGAVFLRSRFGLVRDGHGGVYAAGATHIQLALGLRVEVQQVVALQHAFLKAKSAGHAGLFVCGEKSLQRTVLDGL